MQPHIGSTSQSARTALHSAPDYGSTDAAPMVARLRWPPCPGNPVSSRDTGSGYCLNARLGPRNRESMKAAIRLVCVWKQADSTV